MIKNFEQFINEDHREKEYDRLTGLIKNMEKKIKGTTDKKQIASYQKFIDSWKQEAAELREKIDESQELN